MTSTVSMVGFIIAAVLAAVISLGGVTAAYFLDKHGADSRKSVLSRPASRARGRDHRP